MTTYLGSKLERTSTLSIVLTLPLVGIGRWAPEIDGPVRRCSARRLVTYSPSKPAVPLEKAFDSCGETVLYSCEVQRGKCVLGSKNQFFRGDRFPSKAVPWIVCASSSGYTQVL